MHRQCVVRVSELRWIMGSPLLKTRVMHAVPLWVLWVLGRDFRWSTRPSGYHTLLAREGSWKHVRAMLLRSMPLADVEEGGHDVHESHSGIEASSRGGWGNWALAIHTCI